MTPLRIALAQVNPTVGALSQNAALIRDAVERAAADGCDLVVVPELALTGYPPEDLLLRGGFIDDVEFALSELVASTTDVAVAIGAPVRARNGIEVAPADDARIQRVGPVVNAVVVARNGEVLVTATKRHLPNYDVFDERRYFHAGAGAGAVSVINGTRVGFVVCEDVWVPSGPVRQVVDQGAEVVVVANASPYARGRFAERVAVVGARAIETSRPVLYVNAVGGQDELVFDGQSFAVDATGQVVARAGAFRSETLIVSVGDAVTGEIAEPSDELAEIYGALVCGTRDYIEKNGFRGALVALSGGIDSSLVAAIAVDALGADRVSGFGMPSRYSSEGSLTDAESLAQRLGMRFAVLSIEPAHVALADTLHLALAHEPKGLTDENLQSRIRGVLMMALSNDTGDIVLTTGNKSEMATGYSTLYGDSAGGFAVIKDVNKTLVYQLCRWRNDLAVARGEVPPIPADVLTKPPSAELRPDQRDDQSLPPYEVLDPLLEQYVEGDATADELVAAGHDPAVVSQIVRLVDRSEYKRRQMPPGVRITTKAFGRDRRMPITNRFEV